MQEFRRELKATAPDAIDLLAVERRVQELLNAAGLAVIREAIARADTDAPEVTIDGERWGNRRVLGGTYVTMFGDVEMDRSVYQKAGRGRVAVPVELRLGIVEGRYTPRVARVLTRAVALMPESEAEPFLEELGVAKVSVSTLHRIPRAIAARYEAQRSVIEVALRQADPIPTEAVTIQVSLDGVMVPQDGEYAAGRKTPAPQPPRHEQRYGPSDEEPPADSDQSFGRAWPPTPRWTMRSGTVRPILSPAEPRRSLAKAFPQGGSPHETRNFATRHCTRHARRLRVELGRRACEHPAPKPRDLSKERARRR